MALNAEKLRIARLLAIARPRESLAHRLTKLPLYEREAFERWQRDCVEWCITHDREPGGAYAATLDGKEPPQLSSRLRERLFGPERGIPVAATFAEAAENYAEMRN